MAYTVFDGVRTPPDRPPHERPTKQVFGTTLFEAKQLHVGRSWLMGLRVCNKGASDCYLLCFDSADGATDVSANAVPSYPALYVPAGMTAPFDGGSDGDAFSHGCYVAASSTPEKLTAVGSNVLQINALLIA